MGWFRPDLFRRIIAYSGTFVAQQDDDALLDGVVVSGATPPQPPHPAG